VIQRVDLGQLPLGPVGEVWSEQVQRVFFDKEAEKAELLKRPSEILWSCFVLLGHSVSTAFLVWDLEACCAICKRKKKKDSKLTSMATTSTMDWRSDQFARVKNQFTRVKSSSGINSIPALVIVATIAYLFGVLSSQTLLPVLRISQVVSKADAPKMLDLKTTDGFDDEDQLNQKPGEPDSHINPKPLLLTSPLSEDLVTFDNTDCKMDLGQELIRTVLLEKLFDGVSPFEDFPPEHVVDLLKKERIKGWGSTTTVFRRLMIEVKPCVVIELGTFLGASAIHMAGLAHELGLQTNILCVDDFRGWPGFRNTRFNDIKQKNGDVMLMYQFMQNVVSKNMTGTILPIPFGTISALSMFCTWGILADLIEVDASHDFHSAWADINVAHRLLRPGGVMFGHDYTTKADRQGVRRAVDMFARLNTLTVERDGEHWILRSQTTT
jgi:hypothetical protein